MFEVRTDAAKNRLYLKFVGLLTADDLQQAIQKGLEAIKTLQPEFDVITDISEFKIAAANGAQSIQRAQELLKSHGMRRIIRVVGKEAMGEMQFKRMAKQSGTGWEVVASVAEAESLLDADC